MMIEIDGSFGEGGGQILRSALTLSALEGQPVRIENIRRGRKTPGLQAQHLASVNALAMVCQATVEGAHLGSSHLIFTPGDIRSGRYQFTIGTAGACSLVFQTIFLPLSRASSASTAAIQGGTHVRWSPVFHYLDLVWLPLLKRLGYRAQLKLEAAGYYPQGGGKMSATIRPADMPNPLQWVQRGKLLRVSGFSGVSNLALEIANRQKRQALRKLEGVGSEVKIKAQHFPSPVKGTFIILIAEFESGWAGYSALGEPGKRAEVVAEEAAQGLLDFLDSDATVDEHLADQLLLPLSLASKPSQFRTRQVSQHLLTNAEVIRQFIPVQIEIEAGLGEPGLVTITPPGA